MATSYVGLHVSLSLNDSPQPIVGQITQVDVTHNILVLRRQGGGQEVKVDKARIKGISIVPEPQSTSSQGSGKQSQSTATTSGIRSPEAAKLPKPTGSLKVANGADKKKKKGRKAVADHDQIIQQTGDPSLPSSSLAEDFDFEASAKSFDKAAIWEQIRAQDKSDPAALLVSHNRRTNDELTRGRSGTPVGFSESAGKMRKLRIDENVLSPSPEQEKNEESGGIAAGQESNDQLKKSTQREPIPTEQTSSANVAKSAPDNEQTQRELELLKRRVQILESLSGLSIQPSTIGVQMDPTEFKCTLSPSSLPSTSVVQGGPVTFYLQTSLQANDPKIRFKPAASDAVNGTQGESGKLPEKYNREMGLKLDNGSARVFIERLRAAL